MTATNLSTQIIHNEWNHSTTYQKKSVHQKRKNEADNRRTVSNAWTNSTSEATQIKRKFLRTCEPLTKRLVDE